MQSNSFYSSRSIQGLLAVLALAAAPVLRAQSAEDSTGTLEDWPVQAQVEGAGIAAEYLVRTVSYENESFIARDYLVVEVLFQPELGRRFPLAQGNFTLRVNGRKMALMADSPQFVAASLKYPDWNRPLRAEASAGVGDSTVIVGRQPVEGRFPGDPRPQQRGIPPTRRMPRQEGAEALKPQGSADAVSPAEAVVRAALPESSVVEKPVRGYLYFPYKGKPSSVKTLDLIYSGKAGEATLRLFSRPSGR